MFCFVCVLVWLAVDTWAGCCPRHLHEHDACFVGGRVPRCNSSGGGLRQGKYKYRQQRFGLFISDDTYIVGKYPLLCIIRTGCLLCFLIVFFKIDDLESYRRIKHYCNVYNSREPHMEKEGITSNDSLVAYFSLQVIFLLFLSQVVILFLL